MSLPEDLLAQARLLATLDQRRPKQANLRRAVLQQPSVVRLLR